MSVYVDPLYEHGGSKSFRWKVSCHMFADTLDELHAMAKAIGMRREWFQDKPGFPHYDLVASRRKMAVEFGVIEVSRNDAVLYYRRRRGEVVEPSLFGG
jgi:hypothetical protein